MSMMLKIFFWFSKSQKRSRPWEFTWNQFQRKDKLFLTHKHCMSLMFGSRLQWNHFPLRCKRLLKALQNLDSTVSPSIWIRKLFLVTLLSKLYLEINPILDQKRTFKTYLKQKYSLKFMDLILERQISFMNHSRLILNL